MNLILILVSFAFKMKEFNSCKFTQQRFLRNQRGDMKLFKYDVKG